MAMSRYDPTREMMSLRQVMDRLWNETFPGAYSLITRPEARFVPIDMYETPNEIVLQAQVPGMKPEDIDISVTGNTVVIRGEMKKHAEEKEQNIIVSEIGTGSFYREITLPVPIDANRATATFENGVLTLHLPKSEAAKSKKIQVQAKEQLPPGRQSGQGS